jgi:hypothetical protein
MASARLFVIDGPIEPSGNGIGVLPCNRRQCGLKKEPQSLINRIG